MVGFNRRFAPLAVEVREGLADVAGPRTVLMRINAGRLGGGKWVSDPAESGGRIIGEACHFVDLAAFLIGEDPTEVLGIPGGRDPDNLTLVLRYPGGSVATIVYTTAGGSRLAKEYIEVHAGGFTAVLDDFRQAVLYSGTRRRKLGSGAQDKGQKQELEAFCSAVKAGTPMPIPPASLIATTRATFAVLRSAQTGVPEPVAR